MGTKNQSREDALEAVRYLLKVMEGTPAEAEDYDVIESLAIDATNLISAGPSTRYGASYYGVDVPEEGPCRNTADGY